MPAPGRERLEAVFRAESARVLAGLIRFCGGDFQRAEDALHDACERALARWSEAGLPENPGAWLTTVARRRAVDLARRDREVPAERAAEAAAPASELEPQRLDSGLDDDLLRLVFTCCHPALAPEAQVALTLRTLGGLTTVEIARAFHLPEATLAQRLVRAKGKIRGARIPYRVPERAELEERLEAVAATVYLVFNEGYLATEGEALSRLDLVAEALRLGRLLVELLPGEPEVLGLLALMRLHASRTAARVGADGALVPLEEQDRSRWDAAAIAEGLALLERAMALRRPGPYQLQAAIAALHAEAPTAAATDWGQIRLLYESLHLRWPSPAVALNRAAAIGMAQGPEAGLEALRALRADELGHTHLLPAARADFLRRLGKRRAARAEYDRALELVRTAPERRYLERRRAEVA